MKAIFDQVWSDFKDFSRSRTRLLLCAGMMGFALSQGAKVSPSVRSEKNSEAAVARALAELGFKAERSDVHALKPEAHVSLLPHRQKFVVRAHRNNEPADIFLVNARFSPEQTLLGAPSIHNLTDTDAADERALVASGSSAAWAISQEGVTSAAQYIDVNGEPAPRDFSTVAKVQYALTNLQTTGQLAGIHKRVFKLEPPAYNVRLELGDQTLLVQAAARQAALSLDPRSAPLVGVWVREQTPPRARPGNVITWSVDRVRNMPWFGDERMQWLKAVMFQGVDQIEQLVSQVTGNDGSSAASEELDALFATPAVEAVDPEIGFPPPALEPMLRPPLKGEGKWASLEKDPFVPQNFGAPSPFVTTFIRTDPKRAYSQIFITLWDPRQIALHTVAGSDEPKSPAGETGLGLVPRTPKVITRLVGAFNGGFQTMHGEWGMMADRVLYMPPKPYAATVAELSNGATAFGTWPDNTPIVPKEIVSFRQNMSPLILDEKINPYKRHWWGGVPPGWTEETRTVRSALCLTKQRFIAYFFGFAVDPDSLVLALKRAHCIYGLHLDMNPGHTGFEHYRVAPTGKLPRLGRTLSDSWEAEGHVPSAQGYDFMARLMIKHMGLMNFPRYINADARDFFYLTLRPLLPGAPLSPIISPPESAEGAWRVQGLPQHGWPYAIATTNLRPRASSPNTRVGLIKLDPKWVRAESTREDTTSLILELKSPLGQGSGSASLWHSPDRGFSIGKEPADAKSVHISDGFVTTELDAKTVRAAFGIDGEGMLIYARLTSADPTPQGDALLELLRNLGCEQVLALPRPLGAVLGGANAAPAEPGAEGPAPQTGAHVSFLRAPGSFGERIFPDTAIVPPTQWSAAQRRRHRPSAQPREEFQ